MPAGTFVTAGWHPEPIVVANDILRMQAALRHTEVPMKLALEEVQYNIDDHFDTAGDGEWPPLKKSYEQTKANRAYASGGAAGNILELTGALRESVMNDGSYQVTPHSIAWTGAASPSYSGYHITGTSEMPQRLFPYLNEGGATAIEAVFGEWLDACAAIFTGGGGGLGGVAGSLRPGFTSLGGNRFRGPGGKFAGPGQALF